MDTLGIDAMDGAFSDRQAPENGQTPGSYSFRQRGRLDQLLNI
jgi:hypothetical protein